MDLKDFYLELLQGLAGIIVVISFFIPWAKGGIVSIYSFDRLAGTATFIAGWLLIICSLINLDAFKSQTLEGLKSLFNVFLGILGGILGLVGAIVFYIGIPTSFHLNWGIYVTIIGCIIGAFSSFVLFYRKGGEGRGEGRPRKRKSGGM